MRAISPLLLVALLLVPSASLAAEAPGSVALREWEVPWEDTRPRDPFAAAGDSVWFVGQRGHYLGHLDPASGRFEKVDLAGEPGPHNLVVGEDGAVWFAGNLTGTIGRFDPASGAVEAVAMPDPAARDPHTLVFGPGGDALWFTVQGGNFVGRLEPATRKVKLVRVPVERARPYGIVVAPDGTPWVALFGTNALLSLDPATLEPTVHRLPRAEARPRRVGLTSDGRVWSVDYAGGRLVAYDPAAKAFEEWALPSGEDARPYGMAVDHRDRIWLVETGPQPNRFVGFDPAGESFFTATPIPSGGGSVRHMHFHAPSKTIWFGTDANTIGRATLE